MAAARIKHLSRYMQDAHRFSTNSVETSFVFCLWFTGALSFLVVDTISIFSSILTAVTNKYDPILNEEGSLSVLF